jgi:hypothetical protein
LPLYIRSPRWSAVGPVAAAPMADPGTAEAPWGSPGLFGEQAARTPVSTNEDNMYLRGMC